MSTKYTIFFIITYVLINGITFWAITNHYLPVHGSINVLIALISSSIFGIESFLIGFLIHIVLTTLLFYGLGRFAIRKYEIVIVFVLGIGVSIPILNLSGL